MAASPLPDDNSVAFGWHDDDDLELLEVRRRRPPVIDVSDSEEDLEGLVRLPALSQRGDAEGHRAILNESRERWARLLEEADASIDLLRAHMEEQPDSAAHSPVIGPVAPPAIARPMLEDSENSDDDLEQLEPVAAPINSRFARLIEGAERRRALLDFYRGQQLQELIEEYQAAIDQMSDAAAPPASPALPQPSIEELKAENDESTERKDRFSRECRICWTEVPRRRSVFTKCGHAICRACAESMKNENTAGCIKCPYCREVSTVVNLHETLIEDEPCCSTKENKEEPQTSKKAIKRPAASTGPKSKKRRNK